MFSLGVIFIFRDSESPRNSGPATECQQHHAHPYPRSLRLMWKESVQFRQGSREDSLSAQYHHDLVVGRREDEYQEGGEYFGSRHESTDQRQIREVLKDNNKD